MAALQEINLSERSNIEVLPGYALLTGNMDPSRGKGDNITVNKIYIPRPQAVQRATHYPQQTLPQSDTSMHTTISDTPI